MNRRITVIISAARIWQHGSMKIIAMLNAVTVTASKRIHLEGYRVNLIAKIGQQRFDLLKMKAAGTFKMTDFEYEQLIKYYKALNKKLRKEKGI